MNQVSSSACAVQITQEWSQGRAAYGGLLAGLVYESMNKKITDGRPVRNLQISFIGPVSFEQPLYLETEVFREGKSVTQILGRGIQSGQTQIAIMGSFGHSRASSLSVISEPRLFPEIPSELNAMPYVDGVFPEFTKFFDFRYITKMPFQGSKDSTLRGFVRFKSSQGQIWIAQVLGLVDAWPATALPMLNSPAPASSLNWTIEFIHPQPVLEADEYCQYEAVTEHTANGYVHTRAKIWNMKGELIAISQQTVTIFG